MDSSWETPSTAHSRPASTSMQRGRRKSEPPGLDFRRPRCIDVEAGRECAVDGVSQLESIEQVLRLSGARSGNVQIVQMVLHDLGHGNQTLSEDMRIRHWYIADVACGERRALGRIPGVNLICRRGDLYLFVNFLFVIQRKSDFVRPGGEAERAAAEQEKPFLAYFDFVVARRKIADRKTPGAVGLRSAIFLRATTKSKYAR